MPRDSWTRNQQLRAPNFSPVVQRQHLQQNPLLMHGRGRAHTSPRGWCWAGVSALRWRPTTAPCHEASEAELLEPGAGSSPEPWRRDLGSFWGSLFPPRTARAQGFPSSMPHCFFFPLAAGPCAAMTFFLLQNKGREPCVECAGSQQHAERGAHRVGAAAHAGCAVWGRARGVLPPSPPRSLCFCFAATREGPDAFPQAAERADRPGFPEATAGKGCVGARRCPGDWSCCRSRAGW